MPGGENDEKTATMLGFTPFKKHANKFNYIPRYYDPEKEAREQRRAELRGERAEDAGKEYRPGQMIRTQREARAARRESVAGRSRNRIWVMAVGAVLMLLFAYLLYPRLANYFLQEGDRSGIPAKTETVEGAFDPYAPIVVVPNDYEEQPAENR